VNNIYGGTNYFASGKILHIETTNVQNITVGDIDQLESVLKSSGLSDEDLQKLLDAQKKDGGKAIGSSVTGWIKATAPKVLAGGVKIAAEVGQKLLTDWLKQYYGLPS
jgi:hypothetical protein